MKTRLIHYSGPNGREGVTFTEDLDADVNDFIPVGCKLETDTELDIELPSTFPMDYQLEKL